MTRAPARQVAYLTSSEGGLVRLRRGPLRDAAGGRAPLDRVRDHPLTRALARQVAGRAPIEGFLTPQVLLWPLTGNRDDIVQARGREKHGYRCAGSPVQGCI